MSQRGYWERSQTDLPNYYGENVEWLRPDARPWTLAERFAVSFSREAKPPQPRTRRMGLYDMPEDDPRLDNR